MEYSFNSRPRVWRAIAGSSWLNHLSVSILARVCGGRCELFRQVCGQIVSILARVCGGRVCLTKQR